jgi:hypothetical protein
MAQPENVKPGALFVVPLLGGGHAFGYVTAVYNGFAFCDVFDHVQDSADVPADIEQKPLALKDVQVLGEFTLKPARKAGGPWKVRGTTSRHVLPHNRYVRMGLPPRRIDVVREQPDSPLTSAEAEKYPMLASRFPPYTTALVEVTVKRLAMTPEALIAAWRQGKVSAPPEAEPEAKPKKSAKKSAAQSGSLHVRIKLDHAGFPSESELAARHRLEDAIREADLGAISDAGAGQGHMDVHVKANAATTEKAIKALIKKLKLDAVVTVGEGP